MQVGREKIFMTWDFLTLLYIEETSFTLMNVDRSTSNYVGGGGTEREIL